MSPSDAGCRDGQVAAGGGHIEVYGIAETPAAMVSSAWRQGGAGDDGGVAIPFTVVPAAYLYLLDGDRVLLQQRQNTGYRDGHWAAGAAGHIELHETADGCAVREAEEELGVVVSAGDLEPVTVMLRTDGSADPAEQRVDWFFVTRRWVGRPRVCEPRKCAGVRWYSLARLPRPMPEHERRVLLGFAAGTVAAVTYHGFAADG